MQLPGQIGILVLAIVVSAAIAPAVRAWAQDGAYLVKIAGCADCHTVSLSEPFAGGLRLETPFGSFFTPNITPDKETGIGTWSLADFQRALHGRSPKGFFPYYPAFPYVEYSQIRPEDVEKMWDYLRAQKPVYKINRPHLLNFPYSERQSLWIWQELFLYGKYTPTPEKGKAWNRGAYLVEAFAHCTECHTPRNFMGALEKGQWMAGGDVAISGRMPPNITPGNVTGLGRWSADDWRRFLASGRDPQGRSPSNEMAQVIQNTSGLSDEDREAMVVYLMSLEPRERGVNVP